MADTDFPSSIAFIGGYGHHRVFRLLEDPQIRRPSVAVAPGGEDAAVSREMASSLGEHQWYDSAEVLYEKFKPELVSIGGVFGFNGDLVEQALKHSVPVICEKPLASNWEQLRRIERELQAFPGPVITEFPSRSSPAIRSARAAINDGEIGQVVLITAQKSYRFGDRPGWYADRERYGGTLLWVASSMIDLVPFLSGKCVARVRCIQGNQSQPDFGTMEDHTVTLMDFAQGGAAVVHADYLLPDTSPAHSDDRIRIAGSRGVIEVRNGRCELLNQHHCSRDITDSVQPPPLHRELLDAVMDPAHAIYNNRQSLHTASLLLDCRDAADRGQIIEVRSGSILEIDKPESSLTDRSQGI